MNGEDMDRRMHWLQLARELGQEDDFRALMDDLRHEGAEVLRAALDALCKDYEAETTEGGHTDIGTLWPSQIREVLAAHREVAP